MRREDNRVKCAHNPAVRHPIQTIGATTSIVPAATVPIYHGLGQAPNVLDCIPGGLVTWRLYSLLLFRIKLLQFVYFDDVHEEEVYGKANLWSFLQLMPVSKFVTVC